MIHLTNAIIAENYEFCVEFYSYIKFIWIFVVSLYLTTPNVSTLRFFACCLFEGKLELAGGVNGARETGKQGIVGPTMQNWTSRRGREVQSACWWQRPQTPLNSPIGLTNSVSFASPQAARLTHSVARPLPTQPASLSLRGDPFGLAARSFGTLF